MSHRINPTIPFGTTAASIKANRNLLYLAAKGVIPALVPSARVAQELTAANLAKESRRQDAQFARKQWDGIQHEVNEKWLNGLQANAIGKPPRLMTGYENLPGIRAFMKQNEELLKTNLGRIR